MSKSIALKPRMSEKSYATSVALNTFVFDVPMTENKVTIAAAVDYQNGGRAVFAYTGTIRYGGSNG